ncbi:hypothetical protein ACFL5M_00560 [Candidatus Neomarinimicrobiota bacterium]
MSRSTPLKLIGIAVLLALFTIGCEFVDEDPIAPAADVELNSFIVEGPADSAALLYGSSPVFRWKGEVSPGYVTAYRYAFEEDTMSFDYHDWSTEMQATFDDLEAGDYYFAVQAMDDDDSVEASPAQRYFKVNVSDPIAPEIRFLANPTDGSARPPGASIFFEWTAEDASPFGSVAGYRFRLDGDGNSATTWSSWSLEITSVAYADLEVGDYTFEVEAEDNSGEVSEPAQIAVSVIPPTILVVDDYVPAESEFLNEIATDKLIGEILRDWAWEEWDVAEEGDWPTAGDLSGYTSVIWYVDEAPYFFYYTSHPSDDPDYINNSLVNFLNSGNNLWLMGSEILYFSSAGDSGDIFRAGTFATDYLGLADGGDISGEFTGLTPTEDGILDGFTTDIGIPGLATGTGWPDLLVPATATAIYDVTTADGDSTGAVLYEQGTYNTVFFGVNFAFIATNHNHLTLAPGDMYPVANHILGNIFSE